MSDSRLGMGGVVAGIVIGAVVAIVGYRAFTGGSEPSPPLEPEPATEEPVAVTPEAPEPPVMADVAPVAEPVAVAEVEPEPESEEEEPAENPGRERAERIVQAQMKLMADMVYKPFYEEVPMDAATRAAASELFVESFSAQQKIQQTAMGKGDLTASEVKAQVDAARDQLRDKLSGVLNDDQLASWEEYDAYSDRVLFEALLDGQLRMLAPDLSIESHQTTMAVMAEELAQAIDRFEASSEPYNMDTFNDTQLEGLTAAMERLQMELDAEQTGHAQGFVDQVKVMFDAMKSQPAPP